MRNIFGACYAKLTVEHAYIHINGGAAHRNSSAISGHPAKPAGECGGAGADFATGHGNVGPATGAVTPSYPQQALVQAPPAETYNIPPGTLLRVRIDSAAAHE